MNRYHLKNNLVPLAVFLSVIFFCAVFTASAESLADLQAISKSLDKRKLELDKREKDIRTKEERLKALEDSLIQKDIEIRKMQDSIVARLKEIKIQEDKNLDKLAKDYGSAKAKSAAQVIVKMDIEKSVQLFQRLPSMTAGKILSAMGTIDPEYAAKLSEKLTPDKIQGINAQ
ncbi:MAG: MotE family protein [Deferribacterales bacterium]